MLRQRGVQRLVLEIRTVEELCRHWGAGGDLELVRFGRNSGRVEPVCVNDFLGQEVAYSVLLVLSGV